MCSSGACSSCYVLFLELLHTSHDMGTSELLFPSDEDVEMLARASSVAAEAGVAMRDVLQAVARGDLRLARPKQLLV